MAPSEADRLLGLRRHGGDHERRTAYAVEELDCGLAQDVTDAQIVLIGEQAQIRAGGITAAEVAYAAKHPDRGYACTLSTLSAPDPAAEGGGASYSPDVANEESNGYRFTISGCDGTPASKYRVSAVPADSDATLKTFCADESGILKFVIGGKVSTCFVQGQPVNTGVAAGATVD